MSIQSNINQIFSLAGLVFPHTPLGQEMSKRYQVDKDIEAANKFAEQGREIEESTESWAEERAAKGISTSPEQKKERAEAEAQGQNLLVEKGISAYKAKFDMDPTEKNYENYVRQLAGRPEIEQQKKTYISKLDKQIESKNKAADALAAEQERIAASNRLDLSKLDERARPRVERAYKKAERDTKYLTKNKNKQEA